MGTLSKKLRSTGGGGLKGIGHWCPGCKEAHVIYYERPQGHGGPTWTWNGDVERPTTTPSVRIFITDDEDGNGNKLPTPVERTLCHYFLTGGKIAYCGDCAHALSGQTVDLPDFPGDWGGFDD